MGWKMEGIAWVIYLDCTSMDIGVNQHSNAVTLKLWDTFTPWNDFTMKYYAHSLEGQPPDKWQLLEDHLQNVDN